MIEARADVTVPVGPAHAFEALSDLEHADWLPAVRGLRHIGGPKRGKGARYEVEAGETGGAGLGGVRAALAECPGVVEALGLGPDASVLFICTEGATDPAFFEKIVGHPPRNAVA